MLKLFFRLRRNIAGEHEKNLIVSLTSDRSLSTNTSSFVYSLLFSFFFHLHVQLPHSSTIFNCSDTHTCRFKINSFTGIHEKSCKIHSHLKRLSHMTKSQANKYIYQCIYVKTLHKCVLQNVLFRYLITNNMV